MRAAIIEWKDIFGKSMFHAIIGIDNDDEDSLANKAERWVAMSLSEKAQETCSIEVYSSLVLDKSTMRKVR